MHKIFKNSSLPNILPFYSFTWFKSPFPTDNKCYLKWLQKSHKSAEKLTNFHYNKASQSLMCMRIIYGILLKSRFRFSRSDVGLKFCVSNKFPGEVCAAGPMTAHEK